MGLVLLLALIGVPILEIYLIYQVGARIGGLNTFGLLLLAFFLGSYLAKAQGQMVLVRMQQSLARGEIPASAVLQGLVILLGALLIVIPGFATDVAGILMILPGTRHLLAAALGSWLQRQSRLGKMRVFAGGNGFSFGRGPNPFGAGGFGQGGFGGQSPRDHDLGDDARDVSPRVIDVSPVKVEHSTEGNSDKGDGNEPK